MCVSVALCVFGAAGACADRRADRDTTNPDGVVRLLGNDGWFHARHARRLAHVLEADGTAIELLRTARLDGGCEYPLGLRTIHVSLFDLALAVGLRSSGIALDDEPATRTILAEAGPLGAAVGAAAAALAALAVALVLCRWLPLDPRVAFATVATAPAAASLLLRAMPAHFENATRFGEVDHHHLEPTLLLLGLSALVAGAAARALMARVVGALLLGGVLLAALFSWAGGVLIVGWLCVAVVVACVVVFVSAPTDAAHDGRVASTLLAGVVVAAVGYGALVVVQPLAVLHIVLRVPTLALLGGTALAAAGVVATSGARGAWLRTSRSWLRGGLVVVAGLLATVAMNAAGVFAAAAPHLGARSSLVSEHQAVTLADIAARHQLSFGAAGVGGVAVALVLACVVRHRSRSATPVRHDDVPALVGAVALLVVVAGVLLTWVITHDHATMAAPVIAAAGGVGVATVVALAGMSMVAAGRRLPLAIAAAVAVACVLLGQAAPTLTGAAAWTSSPASERTLLSPPWRAALNTLRTQATSTGAVPLAWLPPTLVMPGDHDLRAAPGVLAGWDRGHMIAAVTGLPTVADHGPSSFASTLFTRAAHDEPDHRAVCPACGEGEAVSFVIVDGHSTFDTLSHDAALAGVPLEPLSRRRAVTLDGAPVAFELIGALAGTWGLRLWQSPFSAPRTGGQQVTGGLEHARVVWQSRERSTPAFLVQPGTRHAEPVVLRLTPRQADLEQLLLAQPDAVVRTDRGIVFGGPVVPSVRVLELVAGATLVVPAVAGDEVTLTLPLATPHGETTYTQRRVATGAEVRFVVPYDAPALAVPAPPSDVDGGRVAAIGPYRITNGARVWNVAVSARAVSAGERVVVE